jgi:hypothetical protein
MLSTHIPDLMLTLDITFLLSDPFQALVVFQTREIGRLAVPSTSDYITFASVLIGSIVSL